MNARSLAEELQMTRPFQLPELEAYLNLARTYDQLHAEMDELFRSNGITQQQYNVLRILRGAGEQGLPSLQIARRMVTRVPDITRLVDRMQRNGLVRRDRCDRDRRVVWVRLTTEGRDLVDRLEGPTDQFHRDRLGHLDPKELATLNALLDKLRNRPDR